MHINSCASEELLFLACAITQWSKKSTIPERPSTSYAFSSLLLIASQLSPLILPCLHHLQLRYSHLVPTERFIELIRLHTMAEVSHHRR